MEHVPAFAHARLAPICRPPSHVQWRRPIQSIWTRRFPVGRPVSLIIITLVIVSRRRRRRRRQTILSCPSPDRRLKSDVSEPGVPCIPEYSRGIVTRKAGALSRLAVGHLPVECTCPSPGNHHRRICPLPYLTANKTNEWVLSKAGVKRELLDNVKARKLAYYVHTTRKQWSCLDEEVMQGTVSGARRRGRPRTAWMDNTKTWTGLSVEESIRKTEDRDKWRK